MIFVVLGTQKFQFNRLLEEIDNLIKRGIITEPVIAQIGYSTYQSNHYETVDFMSNEEFLKMIDSCSILITHAGIGTILQGINLKKKLIVVPRQKAYQEHVDDHQREIAEKFGKMGYVRVCKDIKELETCFRNIDSFLPETFQLHYSNTVDFVNEQLRNFEKDEM